MLPDKNALVLVVGNSEPNGENPAKFRVAGDTPAIRVEPQTDC